MSNQDIAYQVPLLLATRESKAPTKGWRWREGVVCFPEAKCPFCESVIKSKAIWVVEKTKLIGQVVPISGRELILNEPDHPHALDTGVICFGNAYDSMQALFGGLNPESVYTDMADWLRGEYWRHDCEEMGKGSRCSNCEERVDEDESYSFAEDIYCESCFNVVTFFCNNCMETESRDDFYSDPNGRAHCRRCFDRRWFKCEACDNVESQEDQMMFDGDSYCSDCWSERYFNCSECGDDFELSEQRGDEGECSECYTPPPTCSECNEESESDPCDSCGSECAQCSELFIPDRLGVTAECAECDRLYCINCVSGECICAQLTPPLEAVESPSDAAGGVDE